MTNRKLRFSGLGLAVLTAGAIAACSSSDPVPPAGGAGSGAGGAHPGGGAGGLPGVAGANTAGAAGTGTAGTGTAGTGGASMGFACAGTVPTAALITDFSNLVANTGSPGNYTFTGGVLGGTYTYQKDALTSDPTGAMLNIKGKVKDYDGFGLYFQTCYNASTYTGVSFSIKGNVGAKGTLNFRVQTNSNTAIPADPVASGMKGTCVATMANTYAECHASSVDITVTPTPTVVTVNFSQLTGGVPIAAVTGADIVGLEWAFNWDPNAGTAGSGAGGASGGSGGTGGASAGSGGKGGASGKAGAGGASGGSGGASAGSGAGGASGGSGGAVPGSYDADVTIDDVMFLGGPPAGGAGGAGGASAGSGGSSAGSGGKAGGSGGKAGSGG